MTDSAGPARGETGAAASPGKTQLMWWILVLRSVLVLALGVAFLTTGTNVPLLANILATYWAIGALLTLRWARANRGERGSRLALAAGVAGIAAATLLFSRALIQDVISLDTALAILGASAVFTGALRVAGAFHDEKPDHAPRRVQRYVLGASEIVIGVIWIAVGATTQFVLTAAGLWALLGGTVMLLDALPLRRRADARG